MAFQTNSRKVIKAVIFDLDGTLLDTETLSTQAMQMVLDRYDKQSTWELKKKILGMAGPMWSNIVVEWFDLQGQLDPDVLLSEWENNLSNLCADVKECSGAGALVQAIAAKGVPMAIATSSRSSGLAKKRARHEDSIFRHMQVIVCGDDEEVHNGKPAPDIYLAAASRLGIPPSACLAFEDALTGVTSASIAGMAVVGVPDKRLERDPFLAHMEESHLLRSLEEVDLDMLDKLGYEFEC